MVTAVLNLLTACLPPSNGLVAPDFLHNLTPSLSNSLMPELTSIFIPSFLALVNSETLFLNLYFHLPTTNNPSKEECQGTSSPKLATLWKSPSDLLGAATPAGFFFPSCFFPWPLTLKRKKKKKKKKS